MDVLLAAGHGWTSGGVWDDGTTFLLPPERGQTSREVLREHALNERAMFACYGALRAAGVDVKMERGATRNTNDRLDGNWAKFRKDLDTAKGVLFAVELHHDYSKARRGGFGIYPKSATYRATREKALCAAITSAYEAAGLPTRESYADVRGLGLLRRPKCPTLIWECDRLGIVMTDPDASGRAVAAGLLTVLR